MNTEAMRAWVDALRSGEYEQGEGRLNASGKFCCLGVLCEVAIEHGVPVTKKRQPETVSVSYDGDLNFLPPSVQKWIGLSMPATAGRNLNLLDESGEYEKAAALNDERNYTFEMIADAIERTYLQEDQ